MQTPRPFPYGQTPHLDLHTLPLLRGPDPTGLRGTLHLTRSPCPSPVISGSHRRASSSAKGMFNSSMFRKTLLEALWRVDHEVGPVDLCLGLRPQGLCKADRLISLLWSPSFDTESLF